MNQHIVFQLATILTAAAKLKQVAEQAMRKFDQLTTLGMIIFLQYKIKRYVFQRVLRQNLLHQREVDESWLSTSRDPAQLVR